MVTTETVIKELTSMLGVLEKNYVDPHTVGQIMRQVCVGWGREDVVMALANTLIVCYSLLMCRHSELLAPVYSTTCC